MLKGLKKEYLSSVGNVPEKRICDETFMIHNEFFRDTQQWSSLWKAIMSYFYPVLDNIYTSGQGGVVKSNTVFSSDPAVLLNDYVDFVLRSMFPENLPWLRVGFVQGQGRPIQRNKLDIATLRYADEAVELIRYWLKRAGFYEEVRTNLIHDTLLGNACMQAVPSWDEISFIDVPIARLGIGRDSVGRVESASEIFKYQDWEILKHYGREGLDAFRTGIPHNTKAFNFVPPTSAGLGAGSVGSAPSTNSVGQQSDWTQKTKDVIRLYLPNKTYSPLPNNPEFLPEMEYLCYVVTYKTRRLLDVEAYPKLPFAVSKSSTIQGEKYGRGLGNILLPDVSVLNAKKQIEYRADAIQSQSPLLIKGSGFTKPPGDTLRPYQKLFLYQNTTVEPLYQRAPLMQKANTIYDKELEGLGRGLRKDRIDVALADRMTATEFTRRRDASWGLFAPLAGRLYRQIGRPCVENLFSWLLVTEKLPPPPTRLMDQQVKMELDFFSSFSYGQESEVGENLMRAFGPLMELLPDRPDLLDNLMADDFLRDSLTRHELAKYVPPKAEVEAKRKQRMGEQMSMLQAKKVGGAEKAQQQFAQQQTAEQLASEGDGEYSLAQ